MPRPLRIHYAGAIYHVMSRGDRREAIFIDDLVEQMGSRLNIWGESKGSELSIDTNQVVRHSLSRWRDPCESNIRARFIIC